MNIIFAIIEMKIFKSLIDDFIDIDVIFWKNRLKDICGRTCSGAAPHANRGGYLCILVKKKNQ
jgi:hypothetical protein